MKQEFDWHSIEASEVAKILKVSTETGLSSVEVEENTLKYGKNILTKRKRQSAFLRFLLQFHQPLIYILLAATVVTFFLDEFVDSAVIFGVVLINAIIGYIQETKALKAIDALEGSLASKAAVIRNGKKQVIDSMEIVPGDVVLLRSGDKFPADIRLFELRDMQVDESALTGESVPVQKHIDSVPSENVLGDRFCMGFSSTNVTYGQGRGIVVATGDYTEVGKIQQSIAGAQDLETPLTQKIKSFSHLLLWVIIGLSSILIVIGLIRGE
jgi:Ca2+-transporting ATPase